MLICKHSHKTERNNFTFSKVHLSFQPQTNRSEIFKKKSVRNLQTGLKKHVSINLLCMNTTFKYLKYNVQLLQVVRT